MMIKKWLRTKKELVYKARIIQHYHVHSHSTTTSKAGVFDVVECPDWVNILPLTQNEEVILVRQYRQGIDAITLELPGGAIHRGEDPILAAKRELEEETGAVAVEWSKLGCSDVNPAFMENRCYYYLAKAVDIVKDQCLDPQEEIEIVKVPLRDIPGMFQRGEITHSLTHAAFCFFWTTSHN